MRFRTVLGLLAAATLILPVTACSSTSAATGDGSDSNAASSGEFPVTVPHAFGETVIEETPERVATVAWSNHEVPLALGVVPVGMSKATWGDDDGDGVLPWVEDQLEELGADTPELFDETDGIDFEAVAATQPDVILAAYSGLTAEDYDTLSKIAPVVAYPEVAWGTSYAEMIELNSAALGLADEGDALIDELHTTVQTSLDAHPDLADAKFMFAFLDPADLSQIGYYTSHDTRPGFLESLGLPAPELIAETTATTEAFYKTISSEQAEQLADVDVFVTYGDPDGGLIDELQADPLLSKVPAIAEGRIAVLEEDSPLAASANPSPLSIGWGIDEYFGTLAEATQASE
ncbi:MAG: iron-siderophore ABC transporter substrate-binding protein [Leucobacter sp.]